MPVYEFAGDATVSVVAYVEADSEEEAFNKLQQDSCYWECEMVDGDVDNIECMGWAAMNQIAMRNEF